MIADALDQQAHASFKASRDARRASLSLLHEYRKATALRHRAKARII